MAVLPASAALQALKSHWNMDRVPVSPSEIAAAMGVVVAADPSLTKSGHYVPDGFNGKPLITYNPKETPFRQRFTIAHELGHHVLHQVEKDRDNGGDFTMGVNVDADERAANKFAAYLLMPDKMIHAAIAVSGLDSVETLADAFHVSKSAMRYRLKEIGYDVS